MMIHGANGQFYRCEYHKSACVMCRLANGEQLEAIPWPFPRAPLCCSPLIDHDAETGKAVANQIKTGMRIASNPLSAGTLSRIVGRNIAIKPLEIFIERAIDHVAFGYEYRERVRLCALYNDGCDDPLRAPADLTKYRPWYPNPGPPDASSKPIPVTAYMAFATVIGDCRGLWNRGRESWDVIPPNTGPFVVVSYEIDSATGTAAVQLRYDANGGAIPHVREMVGEDWVIRSDIPGSSPEGASAGVSLVVEPGSFFEVKPLSMFRKGLARVGKFAVWTRGARVGKLLNDGSFAIEFGHGIPVRCVQPVGGCVEFLSMGPDWALS